MRANRLRLFVASRRGSIATFIGRKPTSGPFSERRGFSYNSIDETTRDWRMLDWQEIFGSTVSPLELILRGTLIYLGIFAILRLVLRRVAGNVTIADLLMVVLIADAAQNAMAADYRSVTDGVIVITTIIFWNYALDRLAYHFPRIAGFMYPQPLVLVRNGRIMWRNLRREFISEAELLSQLREHGVDDVAQVKIAHMEGDGRISVIKRQ